MKELKSKNGITLIALIVTTIILLILTAVVLRLIFGSEGIVDKTKQSAFVHEYQMVDEAIQMYYENKIMEEAEKYNTSSIIKSWNLLNKIPVRTTNIASILSYGADKTKTVSRLPIKRQLSEMEKIDITAINPTLEKTVQGITGDSLTEMNAYWVNLDLLKLKVQDKYIIDANTLKIYDYEGQYFKNKTWHVIKEGYNKKEILATLAALNATTKESDIFDGWITMSLYYPKNAKEKKWRLGSEGELRYNSNLMWQDYTGPITVRLSDVENIWIKYKIGNEEIIIAPEGKVAVDIQPDTWLPTIVDEVKVKIYYDPESEQQEFKIGNSGWQKYTGEFTVTENTIILARAKKPQYIYDNNGELLETKTIWGTDNFYIGNIDVEIPNPEDNLSAPTITRVEPIEDDEVARVRIEYPNEASRKIYKLNYGVAQNYIEEISIKEYGTHIMAYYYNESGKMSLQSEITIVNEDEEGPQPPEKQREPTEPGYPNEEEVIPPEEVIKAPLIALSTTDVVLKETGISVTIATPSGQTADKIYYKINNGIYQEYTGVFTVNDKCVVTAHYINTEGKYSNNGYKAINNLRDPDKPYVELNATPDEFTKKYGAKSVKVEITSIDASKLEYSLDGIVYETYTNPITITKNQRVYAKGTNNYGTTVEYIDITNIGNREVPIKSKNLGIEINVDPEPMISSTLYSSARVTIAYDQGATGRYYKIGSNGTLKEYTDSFEVTSNCTVYAYATAENAKGKASKVIDHLTTGIAEPEISTFPDTKQAAETTVTINYDKNASEKKYKINNGAYQDYTGEFKVSENCKITAYNKNELNYEATSEYTIENIVKQKVVVIDKGDYFILKLNYPPTASGREYKWQDNGTWKSYPDQGILLIKPQYKDNVLDDSENIKIKIEDDTGKKIDFTGDYYFVTSTIQDLVEHIYLRWDAVAPDQPTIYLSTQEPTRSLNVRITYPTEGIIQKQYKVQKSNGLTTEWLDYEGPILVEENYTIIYARCQDETEMWSKNVTKLITNIDREAPTIAVSVDLVTPKQRVPISVNVTDDVQVNYIKWAQGQKDASYFESNGNAIENETTFYVTENGEYTIFAEDGVGNTRVYNVTVTNVDSSMPEIIATTATGEISTSVTISVNYGTSSTTKKVGVMQSGTMQWYDYTEPFELTSYTVLENGWANANGTVTIYAKGTDSDGNSKTIQETISLLDLDAPNIPVINSNYGYPVLTQYGVGVDGTTTVVYDSRDDITNYYSFNGTTWTEYTGSFDYPQSGTIYAKSVKNTTGLTISTSKTVTQPSDALPMSCYNGNETDGVQSPYRATGSYWMVVSSEMYNQYIEIKGKVTGTTGHGSIGRINVNFFDTDGVTEIPGGCLLNPSIYYSSNYNEPHSIDDKVLVPNGAVYIRFNLSSSGGWNNGTGNSFVYEVKIVNEPQIITTLTIKPTLYKNGVRKGDNNKVMINYFPTSVQKLYKINNGSWQDYQNTEIVLSDGQTIYAKGVDKNGNSTTIVSYTISLSAISDSELIGSEAYDGNTSTFYLGGNVATRYLYIDRTVWQKNIRILSKGYQWISFLNGNNEVLWESGSYRGTDGTFTIPNGTTILRYYFNENGGIYEMMMVD